MGVSNSKYESDTHLSPTEKKFVENAFKTCSQGRQNLIRDELIEAWLTLIDPELVTHVINGCFHSEHSQINVITFQEHFYVVVKGSVTEKSIFIATNIFNDDQTHPQGVLTTKLFNFVKSTVSSYFIMLNHTKPLEYESWKKSKVNIDETDLATYSTYVMKELIRSTRVSALQIEGWLCHHPLFMQIWKEVVIYLYSHMNPIALPKVVGIQAIPICNIPEHANPSFSVLTIGKVMFINETLPNQYRAKWTPLFNSKIHGESFSTLIDRICDKGPTIIVMVDESGYMFGGFASYSWEIAPKFHGDPSTTLFTLKPKMDRFLSSGHNTNFQYLNAHQTTMPNGLGMGGQMNYWGLWLGDDFVRGESSVSCSTFNGYSQMSSHKVFQLQHLEVWKVGQEEELDNEEHGHRTVLTDTGTDQFILELGGQSFHSVGVVEDDQQSVH